MHRFEEISLKRNTVELGEHPKQLKASIIWNHMIGKQGFVYNPMTLY